MRRLGALETAPWIRSVFSSGMGLDWIHETLGRTGALLEGHFRHGALHSTHLFRPSALAWQAGVLSHFVELFTAATPLRPPHRLLSVRGRGLFFGDALARGWGIPLEPSAALERRGDPWVVMDVLFPADLAMLREAGATRVLGLVAVEPAEVCAGLLRHGLSGSWLLEAGWALRREEDCGFCAVGAPAVSAAELG